MTQTVILRVGVSHKIQTVIRLALIVVSIARRVMLLPFGIVALFSLTRLFIVRLGILGTIRIDILTRAAISVPMSLQ